MFPSLERPALPPPLEPPTAVWRNWLRHGFRPFGEVTAAEIPAVLLLSTNAFLMMASYYILKTVREPLILLGGTGLSGVELKTYATAVQAVLLVGLVPLYGFIASRMGRLRLIRGTIAFLVSSLLLFAALGALGTTIGVAFYLWLGMASLIGVAQFWSFANDYYSRAEGERLFPIIAAGGSLGAILGAGVARWLVTHAGLYQLMVIAACLLVVYASVYSLVERLQHALPSAPGTTGRPLTGRGGFELVFRSRYFLLMAVMVMLANLVNTQGEYVFARSVNAQAELLVPSPVPEEAMTRQAHTALRDARRVVVGKLYSEFYGGVNLIGFLIQLLLVSRLFKHLGVHGAMYIFPLVALCAYGSMAAAPVFVLIAAAKTAENSADYSLNNTVRHALFLPTSRDAKYKAKAAIDSFFLRSGDLLAGAAVFAGIHLLHLSVRAFALVNVALVLVWLGISAAVGRQYRRLAEREARGLPPAE
jgi:AAA family ATP:ADP antiporter